MTIKEQIAAEMLHWHERLQTGEPLSETERAYYQSIRETYLAMLKGALDHEK